MNGWWERTRRRLFGPTDSERRRNGWRYAVHCINEGRAAVELLENQLDADDLFGSSDAFNKGARDALRRFDPWLP